MSAVNVWISVSIQWFGEGENKSHLLSENGNIRVFCAFFFLYLFSLYHHCLLPVPFKPRQNPFNRASLIIYEAPDSISFMPTCQEPESSKTGWNWMTGWIQPSDCETRVNVWHKSPRRWRSLAEQPPWRWQQSGFRDLWHVWSFHAWIQAGAEEEDVPLQTPVGQQPRVGHSSQPGLCCPRPETEAPGGPKRCSMSCRWEPPAAAERWRSACFQREQVRRSTLPEGRHVSDSSQRLHESCHDSETQRQICFRSDAETGSGADVAVKERREEPQDDSLGERAALRSDTLQSSSIQHSDGGGDSVGRAARPDELSLPQSSAGEFPIEEQPFL